MFKIRRKFVESCLLIMLLITLFFLTSLSATAQYRRPHKMFTLRSPAFGERDEQPRNLSKYHLTVIPSCRLPLNLSGRLVVL